MRLRLSFRSPLWWCTRRRVCPVAAARSSCCAAAMAAWRARPLCFSLQRLCLRLAAASSLHCSRVPPSAPRLHRLLRRRPAMLLVPRPRAALRQRTWRPRALSSLRQRLRPRPRRHLRHAARRARVARAQPAQAPSRGRLHRRPPQQHWVLCAPQAGRVKATTPPLLCSAARLSSLRRVSLSWPRRARLRLRHRLRWLQLVPVSQRLFRRCSRACHLPA